MHILLAERTYNYNPTASSTVYFQINYTNGNGTFTLRYTFPNSVVSVQQVLDWMTDGDVTDNKSFIGSSDPKGLYVTLGIDYSSYQQIRFYDDEDTVNSITINLGSTYPQQARYLFSHFGFTKKLDSNTGITISTKQVGGYIQCPYMGAFRLPLNVDTGISRGNANIISQVSSEYEIVTTRTEGGTDITPYNVYNSYTYLTRGKKINIVNYPSSLLYSVDNFIEFISEDNCLIQTNYQLSNILFGTTTIYENTVKIDTANSGGTTVKELQENLVTFDITIYHSSTFRGV